MNILNICTNSNFLIFLLVIKIAFLIICIAIPIILVIKKVIPNIKDKKSIIMIVISIIILLLPLIFNCILNENECYVNASVEGIKNAGEEDDSGSTENNIAKGEITIHIGDSRTVDMCATITGDYDKCSFSNDGAYYYDNDIFIAESGMEYNWFVETAIPAVNEILESNSDTFYNIISYMGVNDVFYSAYDYVSKYNELASGDWSGQNIVVVSVNPVNESLESTYGYDVTNEAINEYNKILKNGIDKSKIKYCDTLNQILDTFTTWDGLHYEMPTYYNIYNLAKDCL